METHSDFQTHFFNSKDLFSEESQPIICEMIKQKIIEQDKKRSLNIESVNITTNFMLLPKGLTFYFNANEIGCYADGRIDATLKYSEFKHLLKSEAIQYFHE
ncbi:RsiV family protein [Bacteroidales bacterium OttesenSCG-928-B11]|nr:RsiV family protein [Bacteroidales bacterium OttesenSCG-928-E04]MDL2309197.1 RsiV family protein [Bacteroidales bacterium OttesenSCG-928-C03]MDL2312629.1 RsiV family protein [Bacteroidales bacterium OttesenSCG-928-B11]